MEWFRGRQPATDRLNELFVQASSGDRQLCISRINYGEVYYRVAKDFSEVAATGLTTTLLQVPVEVVSVSDADIDAAAVLKGRFAISYADAFAVVLSLSRNAPLATGDPELAALEKAGILELHWMGK
jgi:ribonuclease VapC